MSGRTPSASAPQMRFRVGHSLKARGSLIAGRAGLFLHQYEGAFALFERAAEQAISVDDANEASWGKCSAAFELGDERMPKAVHELESLESPRLTDRIRLEIARSHLALVGQSGRLRNDDSDAAHLLPQVTDPWVQQRVEVSARSFARTSSALSRGLADAQGDRRRAHESGIGFRSSARQLVDRGGRAWPTAFPAVRRRATSSGTRAGVRRRPLFSAQHCDATRENAARAATAGGRSEDVGAGLCGLSDPHDVRRVPRDTCGGAGRSPQARSLNIRC